MKEAFPIFVLAICAVCFAVGIVVGRHGRRQVQRARKLGLWPPLGQIPTDDDLKRLVKAGETLLAIRMCRQIHNMGLVEAKAVVNAVAEQMGAR